MSMQLGQYNSCHQGQQLPPDHKQKKTQKSSVQLPAASKQTKTSKPADLPVLWEEVERVASNLKIGKPTMAVACDVKIQHRKGSLPSH